MSGPIDIGHGVTAEILRDESGVVQGVRYEHPCGPDPRAANTEGWIPVKPNRPDGWDLVSEEPLAVAPSVLCTACGHHGFIREGRWVPA